MKCIKDDARWKTVVDNNSNADGKFLCISLAAHSAPSAPSVVVEVFAKLEAIQRGVVAGTYRPTSCYHNIPDLFK